MHGGAGSARRFIGLVLTAVVALTCATSGPAMAFMDGDDCSGPACEAMIGCSQAPASQMSSAPSVQPVAVLAAGSRDLALERAEPRGAGPPSRAAARPPVASLGSRSPPAL